jgi:uncharacterized protein YceK
MAYARAGPMHHPVKRLLLLSPLLIAFSGCGSLLVGSEAFHDDAPFYGGTQIDFLLAASFPPILIDLPLSFAVDTALMPIQLLVRLAALNRGRNEARSVTPQPAVWTNPRPAPRPAPAAPAPRPRPDGGFDLQDELLELRGPPRLRLKAGAGAAGRPVR